MITLATLHLASAQEVFTQVKNHLLSQNRKSLLSKDICGYRGQDGTACAAGCLMSDEEAAAIPEGQSWETLVFRGLVTTSKHHHLISALQNVHDIQPVAGWPDSLRELADEEGLVYCEKKHFCSCGTSTHTPHEVGEGGCTRSMAELHPVRNPEKANTHEEWWMGNHSISDYTLEWQRGYRQYDCGCWARGRESTNSLPDET